MLGVTLAMALFTQTSSTVGMSPEEVVRAYRKMDAAGERLTISGWYKATRFFVKPSRPPQQRFVSVIDHESPDSFYCISEDKAHRRVVVAGRTSMLGQIDSSGRFTRIVVPSWMGYSERPSKKLEPPFIHGPAMVVVERALVLTETHWEFGPNREGPREVRGAPEWRIEHFEFQPYLTLDVAIRYVIKLRDESGNPSVKANASNTLAILRRLKVTPRVQRAEMKGERVTGKKQ